MRKFPLSLFAAALATAGFLGCYMETGAANWDSNADPDAGALLDDAGNPIASGVPCDVATILDTYCSSCHGVTPSAPSRLVTYSDLTKPSVANSANSEAQEALVRMKATTSPMPPSGPKPSASEIATFEAWVTGGAAKGASCGGTQVADDAASSTTNYNTPLQCSSNKTWSSGTGSTMRPGDACGRCHGISVAGTLYPTAHEPTNCYGIAAGSTVVITDATNKTVTLTVNSAGNFLSSSSLTAPLTVKVVNGSKTRAMSAKAPSGDCNKCHTATGTQSAPGRIMAP
jgi:hypothetical protein